MRPDQITALASIEEQLVDLVQKECTPIAWKKAKAKAEVEEGYREKKNALATLNLISRIQYVLREVRRDGTGDGAGAGDDRPRATPDEPEDAIGRDAERLVRQARTVLKKHGVKVH